MKDYLTKIILASWYFCGAALAQGNLQDANFKVGLIYPKSGPLAPYAESQAKAVKLGLEEFRADHPELAIHIAVVVADDKSLASEGLKAAERLIAAQKVNLFIGSYSNIVNEALAPLLDSNKIPLFLVRSSGSELIERRQIYAMVPSHRWYGRMLGFYAAQNLKKKRAAIIVHPDDEISTEMTEGFKEAFQKAGGFVVGTWNTDQRNVWNDIKMTEPDTYFVPAALGSKESLLEAILNTKADILTGKRFLRKSPVATLYQVQSYTNLDPHQGVKDFAALYEKRYGQKPDELAAAAYESIRIILQAYFLSLSVKNKPMLESMQTKDLGGIYGIGHFTKDRIFMRPIPITRSIQGAEEFKGRIQPE
ncbi:MAG: ABC transporter substrate-binding protein [Chitinophagaceae bacterium]|nr:ABC transporter substrate-binding protein [Oligoflexus sp.]